MHRETYLLPILIPLQKPYQIRDGASGRITRLRLALRAVAEATLSSLVLAIASQTMKQQRSCYIGEDGASGRIRTSDRSVRSRVLYPAELRMHRETYLLPILIPLQKPYQVRDGASGRITRLRLSLRAVAEATLSSLVLAITSQTMKQQRSCYIGEDGASGRIRTSDRSVRSRVLYPAELRMHRETYLLPILIPLQKPYQVRDGASGRIRTSDRSVRSRVLYPAELRMQMAVRRGFEPRMQLLTAYSLSRGAPSASRPPHHAPLTSASKNLFLLIVAAWRTYYFLGLISQTIFPTLLSFAHFTLN